MILKAPDTLETSNQEPNQSFSQNPANDRITIRVADAPTHRAIIYDVLGNVRARGKFEGRIGNFSTEELPNGIYNVNVDGRKTEKLVISR